MTKLLHYGLLAASVIAYMAFAQTPVGLLAPWLAFWLLLIAMAKRGSRQFISALLMAVVLIGLGSPFSVVMLLALSVSVIILINPQDWAVSAFIALSVIPVQLLVDRPPLPFNVLIVILAQVTITLIGAQLIARFKEV